MIFRGNMDPSSHLIMHLTPKTEIEKGITEIAKGEGVHDFDTQGNQYIDLVAGVTRPVHLGYGNRELAQAIHDQKMELAYFTPMMFANKPALKLAYVLSEIASGEIKRFTFECDGSESVETAMKLAKHYYYFKVDKGRYNIISRKGAYHGVNGVGVSTLGSAVPMRQMMESLAPD
jgi:adenosylmethionine-8-amino-7-oxononanoate aminotransferase